MTDINYLYPPPPQDRVTTMTEEQFELFAQICQQLIEVLRDGKPFAEVEPLLGQMTYKSDVMHVRGYSHPDLPRKLGFSIDFLNTGNSQELYPYRIGMNPGYMEGVDNKKLAALLSLDGPGERQREVVLPIGEFQTTYDFGYGTGEGKTGLGINVTLSYSLAGITTEMITPSKALPEHTRYLSRMSISQIFFKTEEVQNTPSGKLCPYSGVWESEQNPEEKVYVHIGKPMPYINGMSTTWVWKAYQFPRY